MPCIQFLFLIIDIQNIISSSLLSFNKYIYINFYFSEDWFLKDPRFQEVIPSEYLSHKEKYEEAVRKACLIFKKLEEMDAAFDSYR